MSARGYFISFEGGEGTGKSTQSGLLGDAIAAAGHDVVRTREPGGSPLAERIRALILSGTFKSLSADVEAVMFAAARSDHLHKTILPALERGATVVCDRFFDSTSVYQTLTGASADLLDTLRQEATAGCAPDLTVIMDLDADVGTARAAARRGTALPDRFEGEAQDFHSGVREGFLRVARAEPDRCIVVNARGGVEEVAMRVRAAVSERLPGLGLDAAILAR